MKQILSTKLAILPRRRHVIPRPRLTARLNEGLDRAVTLIASPAGSGKSTLLSDWIPQSPRCVTWLSLDKNDNDPAKFWIYVVAAIQRIHADLGQEALAALQSAEAPQLNPIVASIINDLAAFPDVFAMVIDDYHAIDASAIHESFTYLIEHIPSNFHLLITTRVDPPLPLARLRAHDQLNELRARDMRFSLDEARQFLTDVMGLQLSGEELELLDARTEGWIAGLQIAALSMQDRQDVSSFVRAFSGSHRHVIDYLAEEVLSQRPIGTLEFLLHTSILERLNANLCDAVTGNLGSQAILERLERANLFLTPLDTKGEWYRYHHLFQEVLQARLHRTSPEVVPELHLRAGKWHSQEGMIEQAVHHYLAGAEFDHAAQLIERHGGAMLHRGAISSLSKWLDALPKETVRSRPHLCLLRGWTYQWGARIDLNAAQEWSERALEMMQAQAQPSPEFLGEVAALQAMIAATRSKVNLTRDLAQKALDQLPPQSPWLSAVTFTLGTAHLERGEIDAAAKRMEDALRLSEADGVRFIQLSAGSFLGDIHVFRGQLAQAKEIYQQVLAWAGPGVPHKGVAMAHAGLAMIFCEQNQLDAALEHIHLGVSQLEHVGGAWAGFGLYRAQARLQRIQGHGAEALNTLDRTYRKAHSLGISLVANLVAALRAELLLSLGDFSMAQAWANSQKLKPDDPAIDHPGWHETEYLALARVWGSQGKYGEAMLLLDRLLNAAEAQGRTGSAILIHILQSLIFQKEGELAHALEQLEHAVVHAEPRGYMRVFVDEGDPMRDLLIHLRDELGRRPGSTVLAPQRALSYIKHLLSVMKQPAAELASGSSIPMEPLTAREYQVLQLMSDGLSNQEIASTLVLEVSTIKSHIHHLYGKLGSQRRTQAISKARKLGLLSK